MNSGSHHHQTVTDYAKPNKGIQTIHQTVTETTTYEDEPPQFRHGDQLDSMLGNLQANMSRQGVNTVQKGCCNACEKPIVGQVITALGKTWHPEHFTCNHCNQELGTRNFFERDGFPYCEPDYHSLFSPRCAYCNGAILDVCFPLMIEFNDCDIYMYLCDIYILCHTHILCICPDYSQSLKFCLKELSK